MKTILVIATIMMMFFIVNILNSCTGSQELQAEMVSAQLIKIDTAFRYESNPQQMLTWRDENNIEYITYAPLANSFSLGSKMVVLVKR
jgi:hypothetical protein